VPCDPSTTTTGQTPNNPIRRAPPDLYQVVIECRDEAQQRDLYERLKREGMKVRLLVL
jgi:hypothetical protein